MSTNGTRAPETPREGIRYDRRKRAPGGEALRRRPGRHAEEAQLRARIELARLLGDMAEEHQCARRLAAKLAARNTELDVAVDLAMRGLSHADASGQSDAELRRALVGWLEGLGEPSLAASELRKLLDPKNGKQASAMLVRIAVLHARAGDPAGAEEALASASEYDPDDPLPHELLGALAGWAPETVSPRSASEAYVAAAKRRSRAGDKELELEDLLRAFEIDRSSPIAAAALVAGHRSRGHHGAADEVLRDHAMASGIDGEEVHAGRRAAALESDDPARALAAALDQGLDASFDGPEADAFDDLLSRTALFEVLAVRLARRAENATLPRAAAARWMELGRLLAGPLASTERALEAYAKAVAIDPTHTDSLVALRALASQIGDPSWLVEGLLRAATTTDSAGKLAAARSLVDVLRDPVFGRTRIPTTALAAWAHALIAVLDPSDDRARSAAARLEDVVREHEEDLTMARKNLAQIPVGEGRERFLSELAALLRGSPEHARELARVLSELAALRLDDDALRNEAIRVADRIGDHDRVARLCRERLARPAPPARLRIALVSALQRAGDDKGAGDAAKTLFDAVTPWAYATAWMFSGDREARARALFALAPTCSGPAASAIACVAAEELSKIGDAANARKAAELACKGMAGQLDARAHRALALLVTTNDGRFAAAAIERAIDAAGPSSLLAEKLAEVHEALGNTPDAVAWSRRVVALRPGDPRAVQQLVERASRLGDGPALFDAIGWILPQPRPARATADAIVPALRTLGGFDASRAAKVASRALDVLGPRIPLLRTTVGEIAATADDRALSAKLTERWIAAGAPAAERGQMLLSLAAHHQEQVEVDRELEAYARAARAGVDLGVVRERLFSIDLAAVSPDAEIFGLEARAEALLDEGRVDLAVSTLRDLGAALWDMADDRPRAVQFWLRAAQLDSTRGYATLRRDLTTFADATYAADCLAELVERETDRTRGSYIATEAAHASLDANSFARALVLARTALERHAGHTEALATAEVASTTIGREREMSPIYDLVARRALGRFGRRAAHHRAARFFEEKEVPMMALKHAAQAFIAVPGEGSTLEVLQRTADRAHRRNIAVKTLEHVADLSRTTHMRAGWLLRAADMAADDLEGARQKVDVLLKAVSLAPNPRILAQTKGASQQLVELAPEDAEALLMRLQNSSEALSKSLEGPDGARMAILFAELALDTFEDATWAWQALERAAEADSDVDEYANLRPKAKLLARDRNAKEALDRMMAACVKPYSNVGHALFRLLGTIAFEVGDTEARAKALVMGAEKEPDDDDLVREADAALAMHPDEVLEQRFLKKVGAMRRSEALRTLAQKSLDDDAPQSVHLLERALQVAPDDARSDVQRELRDALVKAGRGEEAFGRETDDATKTPEQRAEAWHALARLRDEKHDAKGVVDALLHAAKALPSTDAWTQVAEAADSAGIVDARVDALRALVEMGVDRLVNQKRLARAEGARGMLDAAEAAWRDVWTNDPNDHEADVAIEALLVARASYDKLAEHLAQRAERLALRPDSKEVLRAVRLRRAAILEQRLQRLDEAAEELERLLRDAPGNISALRWLADLCERRNMPERALPLLDELVAKANDELDLQSLEIRLVRMLLAAGNIARANETMSRVFERAPQALEVLELRAEVARAVGDARTLGDALNDSARLSPEDARARSEKLVEAAQAAARAGDTDASLARAKEAASLAPQSASTQLFARGLEYRLRGPGDETEARATIDSLGRNDYEDTLEPDDMALRAFLLAEAEDVVSAGRGEETLRQTLAVVGSEPLVALGLAERAASGGRPEEAMRFYERAVFGNLLGLRKPGAVAMSAAACAEKADARELEWKFLDEAVTDPETRNEAFGHMARRAAVNKDITRSKIALRGLSELREGGARVQTLVELARLLFESEKPADRLEADRTMREAIGLSSSDDAERLRSELSGLRERIPKSSMPPRMVSSAPPRNVSSGPPRSSTSRPPDIIVDVPKVVILDEPAPSIIHPLIVQPAPAAPDLTPGPPLVARISPSSHPKSIDENMDRIAEARAKLDEGKGPEAEALLVQAIRGGSVDAADMLDRIIAREPHRTAALSKVRRQAAELDPGDPNRLVALRDAARADQNPNWVRAIEHVLRVFDPSAPPMKPPPLSAQNVAPGMYALLTRHSREAAGESFGVVWEGAQGVFAKPPSAYGTTGLERVAPGQTTGLARVFELALRALDVPKFALYRRQTAGLPNASVMLLPTPSAILTGASSDDTSEVRWALGEALAAVQTENVLPLAMLDKEGRALWNVLLGAFGPPALGGKLGRENAALAEMLWQTLPSKSQRRLKELLAGADDIPYELVVERARQSGRRIGMFLTGDFSHAARTVATEFMRDPMVLREKGGLRSLCLELPALADLFRLAIRPEYADARWHLPAPGSSQRLSF